MLEGGEGHLYMIREGLTDKTKERMQSGKPPDTTFLKRGKGAPGGSVG